jgi:hypothetical protein
MDATNSEAIGRSKVHVAVVTTLRSNLGCFAEGAVVDPLLLSSQCAQLVQASDLLEVKHGTAAETHQFALHHLSSVGCQTWQEAAQRLPGVSCPGPDGVPALEAYIFGVDAGPDNVGMLGRVREDLRDVLHVLFIGVFCFLHQSHLIVRDLLNHLDGFDLGLLGGGSSRRYWSSVATVANQWRSIGVPKKLRRAAAQIYGADSVNVDSYRKVPGKPLRGRWGTIAAVEQAIIQCGPRIGEVFANALGLALEAAKERDQKAKGKAKAKPAADPKPAAKKRRKIGDEEAEDYQSKQREYKASTVVCTSDPLWRATVAVSAQAKGPITAYINWSLGAKRQYNERLAACAPRVYLGPTPLSLLVSTKALEVRSQLHGLLLDEHCTGVWAPLWASVPEAAKPQMRLLIVTLVLRALAGWQARMVHRADKFPLALLPLVEHDFGTKDPAHLDARWQGGGKPSPSFKTISNTLV